MVINYISGSKELMAIPDKQISKLTTSNSNLKKQKHAEKNDVTIYSNDYYSTNIMFR
jgi:hypothetical protein